MKSKQTSNKKTRFALTGAGIFLIVGLIAVMAVRPPNPTTETPTEETGTSAPLNEADAPTIDSPDAADTSRTERDDPDAVAAPHDADDATGTSPKRQYVWNPNTTDHSNRIRQKLFEIYGTATRPEETPREVIEILVEGVDYATAAKNLLFPPHDRSWPWSKREPAYALEYAEKALAEDPTSVDALFVKFNMASAKEKSQEYALQILEHHQDDEIALRRAAAALRDDFPIEVVSALAPYAEKGKVGFSIRRALAHSYARLGMLDKAREQEQIVFKSSGLRWDQWESWENSKIIVSWPDPIWEDWAEKTKHSPPVESPAPSPPSDPQPSAPDREPPPQGQDRPPLEHARMAADAYARAAKAYHDAFRRAYEHPGSFPPLPAADSPGSSEAYLNAMVGIARAFVMSGDAEQAQAVYTQARQLFTQKEAEEAFRRFDEEDKRQRERRQ